MSRILCIFLLSNFSSLIYAQHLIRSPDGKFGFADENEDVIVSALFDELPRKMGTVMVAVKGKMRGLIDQTGKEIVPFVYANIIPITNLTDRRQVFYQIVVDSSTVGNKKYLKGIIDAAGKIILPPQYDFVGAVDENIVAGRKPGGKVQFQFFTRTGEELYTFPGRTIAEGFDDQMFLVDAVPVNKDGKPVFDKHYEQLIWTDRTCIIYGKHNEKGLCTVDGRIILPFKFLNIVPGFPGQFIGITRENEWTLIDTSGRVIVPLGATSVSKRGTNYEFSSHKEAGSPRGLMNTKGEIILPKAYYFHKVYSNMTGPDTIYSFPQNYFRTEHFETKKMGMIRSNGTVLLPTKHKMTHYCSERHPLMIETFEGLYGLTDTLGNTVVSPVFSYLYWTDDPDVFWGKLASNGKYGLVHCRKILDTKSFIYEEIVRFDCRFVVAIINNKQHLYSPDGRKVSEDYFTGITDTVPKNTRAMFTSLPGFSGKLIATGKTTGKEKVVAGFSDKGEVFYIR